MIKNLLFDLGGVIMNIKRDNCVAAFRQLGMPDADSFFGEYVQKGPFMSLEQGTMTVEEFHAEMHRYIPDANVTDAEIDEAFSRFLTGIPPYRLKWLTELRKKYGVYLLSNTNPIMWNGRIRRDFEQEGGNIHSYFDGIVTSFEAKCMKPEPGIFLYAIEHLGIAPDETLFLDDSKANLAGAEALGFRTAHVVAPEQEFMDTLNELHLV